MAARHHPNLRISLALHVASGGSLPKWSADNAIPERTCRDWTRSKPYRDVVSEIRTESVDRAIGLLTAAVTPVTAEMVRLATKSQDENIRLRACQSLASNLMALQAHAEFGRQIEGLRAEVESLKSGASS